MDRTSSGPRTLALLPWGNVFEDFLDSASLGWQDFFERFTGSFLFGYIEALRAADVHVVMYCVSRRRTPAVIRHRPSATMVRLLPVPATFRLAQRAMRRPYAANARDVFSSRLDRVPPVLLSAARESAFYRATPLVAVARALRRDRCDALLCQEYEHPRFDVCVLLGKLLGIPTFATFQGGAEHVGAAEDRIRPITLRACNGVVIASAAEARRVHERYGVAPAKIGRIPNPVDSRWWRPDDQTQARESLGIDPEALVVMWHGRIEMWTKGLDVLLDAWVEIERRLLDRSLRLLLVGGGREAMKLRIAIAKRRLTTVVSSGEFVHERELIRRALSAADVYVFPSRHEGFPVAPLEAMACGLPIVATDVPSLREIVRPDSGLIVPREDPSLLADAITRLLANEDLRRRLGAAARLCVEEEFSSAAVGSRLRSFFFDREVA